MVTIIKRMRKLRTLLALKLGPGAAIFPPEVSRLHLEFAYKQEDGHTGARNFWRTCLRRLKYHNPAVPMTVSRSTNQSGPALLTVHFTSPSSAGPQSASNPATSTAESSSAPAAVSASDTPTERTEIINMKRRSEGVILEALMKLTNAKQVLPTEEETRQLKELEEFRERSARDAEVQNTYLAKLKREKEILDRARNLVGV